MGEVASSAVRFFLFPQRSLPAGDPMASEPISGKIVASDGNEFPVSGTIESGNGRASWTASIQLPEGVYPPDGVVFQLVVADGKRKTGFFKKTKFTSNRQTTATFHGNGP